MVIQIFLIPHYVAPFTAAFYAIGLQCMRHLRQCKPEGKPVGLALIRLLVTACILLIGVRLAAAPLNLAMNKWPPMGWVIWWYGPGHFGTERAELDSKLQQLPGKQLAIVRYSAKHNVLDEWVYNGADLDDSKVIWARELDSSDNLKLINYYKDRHVWLVEPDNPAGPLAPYPMSAEAAQATR
jgi:hypothetical protein